MAGKVKSDREAPAVTSSYTGPMLTVKEGAERLRVYPATVRAWRVQGKLPQAVRVGWRWLWRKDDIDRMLGLETASAK